MKKDIHPKYNPVVFVDMTTGARFVSRSTKSSDKKEVIAILKEAAAGELKGVLEVNEEPLVSIDFNHNPASSVFDLTQTQVVDGRLVRVLSWYDNEWGFSNRMSDTAVAIGKLG